MKCYGVFYAGYSIVNREVAPYLELDKYCVDGRNTMAKVTFTAKIEWIEFEEGGRHTPPDIVLRRIVRLAFLREIEKLLGER